MDKRCHNCKFWVDLRNCPLYSRELHAEGKQQRYIDEFMNTCFCSLWRARDHDPIKKPKKKITKRSTRARSLLYNIDIEIEPETDDEIREETSSDRRTQITRKTRDKD